MPNEKKNNIMIKAWIGLGIIIVVMLATIFYFQNQISDFGGINQQSVKEYDKHYVFITDNRYSKIWENIFLAAKLEAEVYDAYVEYMGRDLAEEYSAEQLLRIAIDCDVDGIIIEGTNQLQMVELIDEAVEKGIDVVTVLSDSEESRRKCFIGVNQEKMGEIYAKQILKLIGEKGIRSVVILLEEYEEAEENEVYSSIKRLIEEEGEEQYQLHIKGIPINRSTPFSAEEAIRDIIMSGSNRPDVIVCLDSIDTKCAYQAVVDHNKVGEIEILGYHDSEETLQAIRKEIINSTISMDPQTIGGLCIMGLECQEVEENIWVDIDVITLENVGNYLEDEIINY